MKNEEVDYYQLNIKAKFIVRGVLMFFLFIAFIVFIIHCINCFVQGFSFNAILELTTLLLAMAGIFSFVANDIIQPELKFWGKSFELLRIIKLEEKLKMMEDKIDNANDVLRKIFELVEAEKNKPAAEPTASNPRKRKPKTQQPSGTS